MHKSHFISDLFMSIFRQIMANHLEPSFVKHPVAALPLTSSGKAANGDWKHLSILYFDDIYLNFAKNLPNFLKILLFLQILHIQFP